MYQFNQYYVIDCCVLVRCFARDSIAYFGSNIGDGRCRERTYVGEFINKLTESQFLFYQLSDIEIIFHAELDVEATTISTNRPFVQDVLSKTFIFQGLSLEQLNLVAAGLVRVNEIF
jgi:hypothetical protein